ncbi:hypothetical protein GGI21_005155, partial [Coemansia aciculifera]
MTVFARSLLRLTPAVTSVSVNAYNTVKAGSVFTNSYCLMAVELYHWSPFDAYTRSPSANFSPSPFYNFGSTLTSVSSGTNMIDVRISHVAYANARTLTKLDIYIATESDWTSIIYGDSDTPAVYTHLTKLTLDFFAYWYTATWKAIEYVAPFPVLSALAVYYGYPFNDDLLFRGNGETMRSLRLPFRAIVRNILGRFGILERSGVTHVDSVVIGKKVDFDDTFVTEQTDALIKKQVRRMSEATLYL